MMRKGMAGTRIVRSLRARALRRTLIAATASWLLLGLAALPVGASAETFEDFSGGAYQILPPGAEGGENPGKYGTSQVKLYEKLTPKAGNVTPELIEKDFLPEKFGVDAGGGTLRVEKPEAGLEIVRDKEDIPHIYGATREDAMYGSGWVAAKDRGLLLELGLGPAYVAALSVPGLNPFGLLLTDTKFEPSAEAIAYVADQKKVLEEAGPEGAQVIEDLESWVNGVNGYEATLNPSERLKTVTFADAIAGFAFIGSIFGNGGGNEVRNSEFLARLESKLGEEDGQKVFQDLKENNDPEAPTTTSNSFPYDQEPAGPIASVSPGAVLVEPGTESPAAVKAADALKASRKKASNFLLVGAKDAANGHPKAVMGPQLGYYYPEIVFQADMHAPGLDAQGIVAPISPYVFIGRGKDFAWSLTSAGSENTQQFLEQLCNPGEEFNPPTRASTGYWHDGICVPMHLFNAGTLNGEPVSFYETIHGPVSGTVLVHGEPYAIANDRADRGREPAGEIAFSELDSDKVHNPTEFFEAANELETTFNMAYVDDEHIAFFSTGLLPKTASGTNPSLPTLGTGAYDWKGFLSLAEHPHVVDPASGYLTNWNNKPAPGWGAASDQWEQGPIHRVQLFKGFKEGMSESDDASIMNKAATQDLRAVEIWPTIEEVLNKPGPEPSALAKSAVKLIRKWVAKGASRYGKEGPKAPAAAILDAAWTPIGEAVLSPVLGSLLPEFESLAGPNNGENSGGSSYGAGWYGYVYKALRQVLGDTVAEPFSTGYCGAGNLEACRNSLWNAIQGAAEKLQTEQGSEMKKWKAAKVRIEFEPGFIHGIPTMAWTNRSTFQQIIEFTGHAPELLSSRR